MQVSQGTTVKQDIMPAINTIKDSLLARASGNTVLVEKINEIMTALNAKDDAWWVAHRPWQVGKNSANVHGEIWREVAAEVIKN